MIHVDGSRGEGGGQILRTALSLSMVTGLPFDIERIRARRARPGLRRQHLTAVRAAQSICRAEVQGAAVGSLALSFRPHPVQAGDYAFDVGTAGSTTLVAQTLLPALLTVPGRSRLRITGGTHNYQSPPWEFFARAYLIQLERMGAAVAATLERPGYYPAGGGVLAVELTGRREPLLPLELTDRGPLLRTAAEAVICRLPRSIAERELAVVADALGWQDLAVREDRRGEGPGNVLLLTVTCEGVTEVFSGFGRRGVAAEQVAAEAVDEARAYLASRAAAGPHLADQLLLPMALAGGGSLSAVAASRHAHSNAAVIEQFLPVTIRVAPEPDGSCTIAVTAGRADP